MLSGLPLKTWYKSTPFQMCATVRAKTTKQKRRETKLLICDKNGHEMQIQYVVILLEIQYINNL